MNEVSIKTRINRNTYSTGHIRQTNNKKTMDLSETAITNIEVKDINTTYQYLNHLPKYRNQYNLYTNEDEYHIKSTEKSKIAKNSVKKKLNA